MPARAWSVPSLGARTMGALTSGVTAAQNLVGAVAPALKSVRKRFKWPDYAGETGAGRLFRAAGSASIAGRALGVSLAGNVAPVRPDPIVKPPLTKTEAAVKQAEEKARVTRLRAQAGYSGSDAINTRPTVGGAGGTVG